VHHKQKKNLILLNKVKLKALLKHKIVKFSNVWIYVVSQFCPISYRTWQELLPAMAWLLVCVCLCRRVVLWGWLTRFSVIHILFTTNYGWVLETFWPFHVYWPLVQNWKLGVKPGIQIGRTVTVNARFLSVTK
jgi:hypothetical protein